jgi:hypothetical protein
MTSRLQALPGPRVRVEDPRCEPRTISRCGALRSPAHSAADVTPAQAGRRPAASRSAAQDALVGGACPRREACAALGANPTIPSIPAQGDRTCPRTPASAVSSASSVVAWRGRSCVQDKGVVRPQGGTSTGLVRPQSRPSPALICSCPRRWTGRRANRARLARCPRPATPAARHQGSQIPAPSLTKEPSL